MSFWEPSRGTRLRPTEAHTESTQDPFGCRPRPDTPNTLSSYDSLAANERSLSQSGLVQNPSAGGLAFAPGSAARHGLASARATVEAARSSRRTGVCLVCMVERRDSP